MVQDTHYDLSEPRVRVRQDLPYLEECWMEGIIDSNLWSWIDPVLGTPWQNPIIHASGHRVIWAHPDFSQDCQIYPNMATIIAPFKYQYNFIAKKVILEFELKLSNLGNIDPNGSFFGLVESVNAAGRSFVSANICGFGVSGGGNLVTVTDEDAIRTVNTGFGEDLTDFNKLKIELSYGHAQFFLNELQIADHTTDLTASIYTPSFYLLNMAGGAPDSAYIYLGTIRTRMEDRV